MGTFARVVGLPLKLLTEYSPSNVVFIDQTVHEELEATLAYSDSVTVSSISGKDCIEKPRRRRWCFSQI